MKGMIRILLMLCLVAAFWIPSFADIFEEVNGKWSGNWTPKDGVPDPVTVELKLDSPQRLSGQFVTPVPMPFTNASFDLKTRTAKIEAMDPKSGKHYKIDGKLQGTDLKGTLAIDEVKGDLLLIKWTFVPRVLR